MFLTGNMAQTVIKKMLEMGFHEGIPAVAAAMRTKMVTTQLAEVGGFVADQVTIPTPPKKSQRSASVSSTVSHGSQLSQASRDIYNALPKPYLIPEKAELGVPIIAFNVTNANSDIFTEGLDDSKLAKFGSSVGRKTPQEVSNLAFAIITRDKQAGFGVTKDGEVTAVFIGPEAERRSELFAVLNTYAADHCGGWHLQCYNTVLPKAYSDNGWSPVAVQLKDTINYPSDWNKAEYAKFDNGEPARVFFVRDPYRILHPVMKSRDDLPESLPAVAMPDGEKGRPAEVFQIKMEAKTKIDAAVKNIKQQLNDTLGIADFGPVSHDPPSEACQVIPLHMDADDGGIYACRIQPSKSKLNPKPIEVFRIPGNRVEHLDIHLGKPLNVPASPFHGQSHGQGI